ncbi:hypothetical protein GCM10011581_02640 [Saccharopolyspora subtropica]|uniref:SAF domain-containing protein n=1 Tax=Saccharopolyspora thermophila TaxID=89367 RepID=A0A917JK67_9PSEU|nr:SAF domain-containing protein [Saccharopolyspora subtropica]GGI69081.1 hypothetical protein GCM10011581_02640 [Saccharopolyspora subtropica]
MAPDRLDPTLRDRISALLATRRGVRLLALRRATALALLVLAAGLAVQPRHGPPESSVLVAARDLRPGQQLSGADVELRAVPRHLVPDGVLRAAAAADGRVLTQAVRRGEPLTDVRFAGSAVPSRAGSAATPIRLADPDVADFLAPGRRVDIITKITRSGHSSVLAEAVPVLAVQPADNHGDQGRLIFVGLPGEQAAAVAAASLDQSVTITLR